MHYTFMATGILNQLREFEIWCHTRSVILPITKDGKTLNYPVNLQIRPIQFYDIIFAKENFDVVMNTLSQFDGNLRGSSRFPSFPMAVLRKGLKLNKIPEWNKEAGQLLFPKLDICTYGIGVREDEMKDFGAKEGVHEAI